VQLGKEKFLKEFGTMENLLANTDKLKGKMKRMLSQQRERAFV
jgi:DNA polymerase-1